MPKNVRYSKQKPETLKFYKVAREPKLANKCKECNFMTTSQEHFEKHIKHQFLAFQV